MAPREPGPLFAGCFCAGLFLSAGFLPSWGILVVSRAFGEYQDSPDGTYFFAGGILLLPAIGLGLLGLVIVLTQRTWLTRLLTLTICVLASLAPHFLFGLP
jgi:hypothetical protein